MVDLIQEHAHLNTVLFCQAAIVKAWTNLDTSNTKPGGVARVHLAVIVLRIKLLECLKPTLYYSWSHMSRKSEGINIEFQN